MLRRIVLLTLLIAAVLPVQRLRADDIPGVVRNTQDSGDAPRAPDDAARRFKVPEGFNVALFVGEPDVAQPIGS